MTIQQLKRLCRQEAKEIASGYLEALLGDEQVFAQKFGDRSTAEQNAMRWALTELAGKLAPAKYLTRQQLIDHMRAEYTRRAKAEGWRDSELALTLASVPKDASKLIRDWKRKGGAK